MHHHRKIPRRVADFLQNMAEDWLGNGIMLALFCAGSYIAKLITGN